MSQTSVVSPPAPAVSAAVAASARSVYVAATFTADAVADVLTFWMQELGLGAAVANAPYNQVFQELLTPTSTLMRNSNGANVVLVRPEDWLRAHAADRPDDVVERASREFADALRAAAQRTASPVVFVLCPSRPVEGELGRRLAAARTLLHETAESLRNVTVVSEADVALYRPATIYDPERDALGHVPYTPEYFAALGTAIARRLHARWKPSAKVTVLDCDNTLWRGVVGEDGPQGVYCGGGFGHLQDFMAKLQTRGIVLALNSKNEEADVLEVFRQRDDMRLRLEHLVCWRVNWQSKALNLRAIADELNLGIDSFVFVDDNPVECAEVREAHPDVTTLQLPQETEIEDFLAHVWRFDVLATTEEDKKRTELYKLNVERSRLESQVTDISKFISALDLKFDVAPATASEIPRISQLTMRTNQFNLTTVRRSEAEIEELQRGGTEVLRCVVKDRFGDYGLVGVLVFAFRDDALALDSWMLSCRVLGRGVEHAMLRELGQRAVAAGKEWVELRFVPTKKNTPARNFVESLGVTGTAAGAAGELLYRVPASVAVQATYSTGYAQQQLEVSRQRDAKPAKVDPERRPPSDVYQRIATELRTAAGVLRAMRDAQPRRHGGSGERVTPRTKTERALAEMWRDLLNLVDVGIHDRYEDLGGTSLDAVSLFAWVERTYGRPMPLTTILEADTIEKLARRIDGDDRGGRDLPPSVVQLRDGQGEIPLFFVHDGLGETLLYVNLARRLPAGIPVYGLEPRSAPGTSMVHTRVVDMAGHYIASLRRVQPKGPYRLAGMCAGGVIAFEMARQLRDAGEDVALVAMFDAVARGATPVVAPKKKADLSPLSGALANPSWASVREVAEWLSRKATSRLRWNARLVERAVRFRVAVGLAERGADGVRALAGLSVQEIYDQAERRHVPSVLQDVRVVLFRATRGEGIDTPYRELYSDADLAWGRYTAGRVEIVDVPGGHASMLQEPNVEAIAQRMRSALTPRPAS